MTTIAERLTKQYALTHPGAIKASNAKELLLRCRNLLVKHGIVKRKNAKGRGKRGRRRRTRRKKRRRRTRRKKRRRRTRRKKRRTKGRRRR